MTETRQRVVRRFVQLLVQAALFGALLFACAGTLEYARGWLFIGLFLALVVANGVYVLPRNPDVIAARGATGQQGTRTFDKVLMSLYTVVYLGQLGVAALDAGRLDWSRLGWSWALAGAALMIVADLPVAAAMAVNRNLETTVRIQAERGHQVAASGPYRFVRHPMYVGMLLQLPAASLVLGSAWSLALAGVCAALMVVRTALEDRALRRDLPGYAEYATRTRYRLVPGVW